jgi:hypothetical protein
MREVVERALEHHELVRVDAADGRTLAFNPAHVISRGSSRPPR